MADANSVMVQVRVRRLPTYGYSEKEQKGRSKSMANAEANCVDVLQSKTIKLEFSPADKPMKEFSFDNVFGPEDNQQKVYDTGVRKLIDKCLQGYNGCIFVYGQTASGKTYTMTGNKETEAGKGVIFRAIDHIVKHIKENHEKIGENAMGEETQLEYSVKASYLEIYQEQLRDLLSDKDAQNQAELRIRMDPESLNGKELHVQGITERFVVEFNDYVKILEGTLRQII
jgi:hypothetical protein